MKTFSKTILEKHYKSPSKWGREIQSYVKIERHFDFEEGLRYSVSTPNFACCMPNLRDALLVALERESIGMGKYDSLKDLLTRRKLWNQIC